MIMSSIEERLARLETQQLQAIGRINACQTLLVNLLLDLALRAPDPVEAAQQMRQTWQAGALQTLKPRPGSDPARTAVLMQEYEQAIDHLSAQLVEAVREVHNRDSKSGSGQ